MADCGCGMGFFGKKHFLDPEDEAWHLDSWRWMLMHFGGLARLKQSPIVFASSEFFAPTEAMGHVRAEHIFGCVKRHARMEEWPCALIAQPESVPLRVGELASLKRVSGGMPLGTFKVEKDRTVTISYDLAKLDEPATLIATFAHELAHYRLATVREETPGGHDMHEFATDLMTVFLGFGVFGANGAFNFRQFGGTFSHGWQTSGAGYLRERDWVFALAVFLALRGEETDLLRRHLKRHLYSDLNAATKYLARNPALLEQHRGF
jgi:hypothetical protein